MRKILIVDARKCNMCKACELACSLVKTRECNPEYSRIRVMRMVGRGLNFPVVCRQCSRPLCSEACPTDAIVRNEETGAMVVDDELCIGCHLCVEACRLGGVFIDPVGETVMKCDLCGGNPACVDSCVYGALDFLSVSEGAYKKRQEAIESIIAEKMQRIS